MTIRPRNAVRAMRDTLTYQHIRISKLSFELHRVAMKTRWERQAAQKLLNMTTLSPDMVIFLLAFLLIVIEWMEKKCDAPRCPTCFPV